MTVIGPFGFMGGLNSNAATNTIGKDQMSDAQDVYLVEGDLLKRPGSRTLNASAISGTPAVTGITDWQTAAGQRYQVVTAGTKIFQTADLGTTLTDITGAVSITSGATNQSTWASLNNILVRCGGPDVPIKWTGTGNAANLGGSPPTGNLCYTVNNFLFISGVSSLPSRVYYSNVIDPETWGASNYVDFRKDDGDKVTALSGMDQSLVIFKRNSIGKFDTTSLTISGSTTLGPLYTSVPGTGCVGPTALDVLPDGKIVFLSTNSHVYLYDGSVLEDIGDPLPPKSNIQDKLNNLVLLQYTVIRYYPTKKQIWISGINSGSSTNNIILVFDYTRHVWLAPFTNINANAMAACIDTRSTINHPVIFLTGNFAGQVYEQDFGNTNPENSSSSTIDGYGTVTIQFSGQGANFIPRSLIVPTEYEGAYNVEVNYGYNGFTQVPTSTLMSVNVSGAIGLDSFVLDTNTLAGGSTIRNIVQVNNTNTITSMQVQFRNRLPSQPYIIHPFWISDEIEI